MNVSFTVVETGHREVIATRPPWPMYFLDLAKAVSTRASCPRASVGAVATRDNRVLVTGYNGSPPGQAHCMDVGCDMVDGHCIRTVHAEANLVATAARYGISLNGATIYVHAKTNDGRILPVCHRCRMLLESAGAQSRTSEDTW